VALFESQKNIFLKVLSLRKFKKEKKREEKSHLEEPDYISVI